MNNIQQAISQLNPSTAPNTGFFNALDQSMNGVPAMFHNVGNLLHAKYYSSSREDINDYFKPIISNLEVFYRAQHGLSNDQSINPHAKPFDDFLGSTVPKIILKQVIAQFIAPESCDLHPHLEINGKKCMNALMPSNEVLSEMSAYTDFLKTYDRTYKYSSKLAFILSEHFSLLKHSQIALNHAERV